MKGDKYMKKTLALTLLFCFLAVILLSAVILSIHAGHDCINEICTICKIAKVFEQLRKINTIVILVGVSFFSALFYAKVSELLQIYPANPVEANIKMSN